MIKIRLYRSENDIEIDANIPEGIVYTINRKKINKHSKKEKK